MANYQVRLITIGNDRLHPVLTTDEGVPLVLPNLWADDLVRYRRLNTAKSYLADLVVMYRWAAKAGINVHQRVSSLVGFRRSEVRRLVKALFTTSLGLQASSQTGARRVQAITSFIGFAFDIYNDVNLDVEKRQLGKQAKDHLLAMVAKYGGLQRSQPSGSRPATSLSEEELNTISSVLHPASSSNPFKDENIRLRNYCIFHLAVEAWMRRSELALIETTDVQFGAEPTVRVKWPSQNNLSKRKDGAGFKTEARELPISENLARVLALYTNTARASILPPGVISTALFPSARDGRRLTTGAINTIFATVGRVPEVADIAKRIHPHGLRASGADEFRRHSGESLINASSMQDCMEYMGGWKPGSTMPRHYSRAAISEQVNKIARRGK